MEALLAASNEHYGENSRNFDVDSLLHKMEYGTLFKRSLV